MVNLKKVWLRLGWLFQILFFLFLVFGSVITHYFENIFTLFFSVGLPILVVVNFIVFIYFAFQKNKRALYSLLALIIYGVSHVLFFNFTLLDKKAIQDSFSILTFNVRGGGGNKFRHNTLNTVKTVDSILNFIENQDIDVLVFQEFWSYKTKKIKKYPYAFFGKRKDTHKSLQVIFSKYPIVNKGYIDFPNTANNAMYADVELMGEIVRVYNVHLQSFNIEVDSSLLGVSGLISVYPKINKGQKLKSEQTVLLQEHSNAFKGRTIICGDFNSTPFSKTYIILKAGRQDSFIERGSGLGASYSLSHYPMRLDYILPDESFEVISYKNFDLALSDHDPILVELNLNN